MEETPLEMLKIVLMVIFSLSLLLLIIKYKAINSYLTRSQVSCRLPAEKLNRLVKEISILPLPEKLFVLQSLVGRNYRAYLDVTGSEVTLAGVYWAEEQIKPPDYAG